MAVAVAVAVAVQASATAEPVALGHPWSVRPHHLAAAAVAAVAATAALMLGINPQLTPDDLVAGMRASAAPFVQVPLLGNCAADDNPGRCTCTGTACGAGQLDADQALVWAADPSAYVAPARTAPTLRNSAIEACAVLLGRPVPPVDAPAPTPTPVPVDPPAASSGGGAVSLAWLWLLGMAALALRRHQI